MDEDDFSPAGLQAGASPGKKASRLKGLKPVSPKKNKGKPKGAGKAARGAKTGKGSRPGKLPCLCCSQPRVSNTRFCKEHKRSVDAMWYQAEAEVEKDPDSEAKEILDEIMADDGRAAAAVTKFSKDNPPTAKYKRKALINWTEYRRSFGVKVTRRDRTSDVPMTDGVQNMGYGHQGLERRAG